ncbi:hypothetical protein ACFY7C_21385 [Streptomyces sp. NPDC012769]|uniref:hypothetical protein n=1 Tax=Streptomyces sp. NPDC012769 TaxID=3364848 RepID=UPI0036CF2E5C
MNRHERKEDEVRRMLRAAQPPVPGDLAARAVARGTRRLRRDRVLRRLGWALLAAVVVAFVVWASMVRPWEVPAATTPPLEGW